MATLSPIPPFPALADRAAGTYNSKAYAFGNHMGAVFQPEMEALLPELQAAATASAGAIAAAHYKGPWASLTGPLAIPASVFHGTAVYMLTESVANVAAEVPGVSAKWIAVSAAPVLELISTTNATAVATVEWTNFEALAATYSHLELHCSGVLGSAAAANLTGQVRQSGAWQTATWVSSDIPPSASGAGLSLTNQLTNVAKQAMVLQINVRHLGVTAIAHVDFVARGGAMTALVLGYSSFAVATTPTTPIQGLRINASTGNLTGTFRLYGVRK